MPPSSVTTPRAYFLKLHAWSVEEDVLPGVEEHVSSVEGIWVAALLCARNHPKGPISRKPVCSLEGQEMTPVVKFQMGKLPPEGTWAFESWGVQRLLPYQRGLLRKNSAWRRQGRLPSVVAAHLARCHLRSLSCFTQCGRDFQETVL